MNTKTLCLVGICLASFVLAAIVVWCINEGTRLDDGDLHTALSNDKDTDSDNTDSESRNTGIVISLTQNHGHQIPPPPPIDENARRRLVNTVLVMVWHEGHILLIERHADSTYNRESHKFQWGIVDNNSLAELQDRLVSLFRVKEGETFMMDPFYNPSSTILRINTDKHSVVINTLGPFRNMRPRPEIVMLDKNDTIDGKEMSLPEFYEKWSDIQKVIFS